MDLVIQHMALFLVSWYWNSLVLGALLSFGSYVSRGQREQVVAITDPIELFFTPGDVNPNVLATVRIPPP